MSATNLIFKLLFIIIPLIGVIIFILTTSDQNPDYCSLYVNSTKELVLSNLRNCAANCWKKHDFGGDTSNDDCSMIEISSIDDSITLADLEDIHKDARVYFSHDLPGNTTFRIILRYNSTGPEISILNYGLCGNGFIEHGEMCDGDISTCGMDDFEFGVCSGSKYCSEDCICGSVRDCGLCSNLIPSNSNPSTNNDWCRYCNTTYERICDDQLDNDCDMVIDDQDNDCNPSAPPSSPTQPPQLQCGSLGTPGCPTNICLKNSPDKNGVYYQCNDNIKIINTNPSNSDSCDSPGCIYEFTHDSSLAYLDVYDTDDWPRLEDEMVSQLSTIQFLGFTIQVHENVADIFQAISDELEPYHVSGSTYDFPSGTYTFVNYGTFNFRANVNNPTVLSSHSFGIAIDLNAVTNPNQPSGGDCQFDLPPELVWAFESRGFRWGGRFWPSFDPMHFEYIPSCIS